MKGKKTGGRKPYPIHELSDTAITVLAALYAKKGVQIAYRCTEFDMVSILTIREHTAVSAMSVMRLSGYSKGRIYQRLKTSIKRGVIEQTRTRPNQYRLTERGLLAYQLYQQRYNERLEAIHSAIRQSEFQYGIF